jgi:hypothetical protein
LSAREFALIVLPDYLFANNWIVTMKVLWSWQSDHPGQVSRHFVREALEQAIADLKNRTGKLKSCS